MLADKLISVCESLGWSVYEDEESGEVELRKHSPAGEDFSFTVDADSFIGDIKVYYENFDVDEHVEMWIEAKQSGVPGVPSIKALVHDAEDIENMLEELVIALCGVQRDSEKKWFTLTYREHSIMTVDIFAESYEEAEKEWDRMIQKGEIDFCDMDVYDTELEIEEDPEDGE